MKKYIFLFLSLLSSINLSAQEKGLDQRIDEAFQPISDFFSKYVFYPIGDYPFVIYLLVGSALFFTIYFGFPNLKYFWTAINVVRGKYYKLEKNDNDSKDGEVSQEIFTAHFKNISQSRFKEMIKMVEDKQIDDIDVAKEVLLGWEDLVDKEGQEVPFNKSTLNQLLEVRGFATAVGFAFMESNEEIFVKN